MNFKLLFLTLILFTTIINAQITITDLEDSENRIINEIHDLDGKTVTIFEDTQVQINEAIVTIKEGAIDEIGNQVNRIIFVVIGVFFFCLSAFMFFLSIITIKKYNYFTQTAEDYIKNQIQDVLIENETDKDNLKKGIFKRKNKNRMVKKK